MKRSRPYGRGNVYPRGNVWWIRYAIPGNDNHRESAGPGKTKEDAEKLLERRLREVENDREGIRRFVGRKGERVTVSELLDKLVEDHELRGLKSLRTTRQHLKAVRKRLGNYRATAITPELVLRYVRWRRGDGVADATIDRELELFRRAFKLAVKARVVGFAPEVPRLVKTHANARQGFLETETFLKLLAAIRSVDFRDFVEWLWWTGMRPGEAASLTWEGYQRDADELRLTAAAAKIGRARTIPLISELAEIIKRRAARRLVGCRLIFHKAGYSLCDKKGGLQHRNYEDWYAACEAVELPGAGEEGRIIPYDLRRTAARNLVRAGVSVKVAMSITGHLTRATFDRYDIASRDDQRAALEAVARQAGPARNPHTGGGE